MQITSRDLAIVLRGQYIFEEERFYRYHNDNPSHLTIAETATKTAFVMFPDDETKRLNFLNYVIGATNDYDA